MEIVEAVAPERVLIKLDFLKPFEAHNMAEYLLAERDGATEFTWAMYGPEQLLSKADGPVLQHGQDGRRAVRAGPGALKTVAERGEA
jgi:hypothetical protein